MPGARKSAVPAASDPPPLVAELINGFRLRHNGRDLDVPIRKCQALLAILALSPGIAMSRERLRALLWSDHDAVNAASNLRQCLHALRHRVLHVVDPDLLEVSRDVVSLRDGAYQTDIAILLDDLRKGRIPEAIAEGLPILSDVLVGLEYLDPEFHDWVLEQRARLQEKVLTELRVVMADQRENSAAAAAILLAHDPFDEAACRVLIRHHARSGEHARALRVYQSLWTLLEETFGEEPSTETQDLIVELKSGGLEPPREITPDSARPDRMRICVQPIDLTGLAARSARLAEGFRLDLIAGLTRFREWCVFDGQRSVALANQPHEPAYLVDLIALDTGEVLRFSLLIKEVASDGYVWSERFAIRLDSWTDSQNQLIRRIAAALNVHISADRIQHYLSTDRFPLETYDRWLMGHNLVMEYSAASWDRADAIFHSLIADRPGFARAYSSLAGMENTRHMAFPGETYPPDRKGEALSLARQAVRLDPLDARTQLAFGWSCAMSSDVRLAALSFHLAHHNNENETWTLISAATGLAFCGEAGDARNLLASFQDLELNPTPMHWSYIAAIHFLTGDYVACVDASVRSEEVTADVPAWHAAALALLGRAQEAEATGRRLVDRMRQQWRAGEPPTEDAIRNWLFSSFPIHNQDRRLALRDGLDRAGLVSEDAAGRY